MRLHPWLAVFIALIPTWVQAKTPPSSFLTKIPFLRSLARDSALIFSGTVLGVEHLSPDSATVATTRITFRVQEAIRGVRRRQVLQIQEWDGLWNSGERYRRGEHVLLFLYPANRLGLTSPVGGRLGRFRVNEAGEVAVETSNGKNRHTRVVDARSLRAAIRRAASE